jgi:hypothetical protein
MLAAVQGIVATPELLDRARARKHKPTRRRERCIPVTLSLAVGAAPSPQSMAALLAARVDDPTWPGPHNRATRRARVRVQGPDDLCRRRRGHAHRQAFADLARAEASYRAAIVLAREEVSRARAQQWARRLEAACGDDARPDASGGVALGAEGDPLLALERRGRAAFEAWARELEALALLEAEDAELSAVEEEPSGREVLAQEMGPARSLVQLGDTIQRTGPPRVGMAGAVNIRPVWAHSGGATRVR